jgi:hypothetical protein
MGMTTPPPGAAPKEPPTPPAGQEDPAEKPKKPEAGAPTRLNPVQDYLTAGTGGLGGVGGWMTTLAKEKLPGAIVAQEGALAKLNSAIQLGNMKGLNGIKVLAHEQGKIDAEVGNLKETKGVGKAFRWGGVLLSAGAEAFLAYQRRQDAGDALSAAGTAAAFTYFAPWLYAVDAMTGHVLQDTLSMSVRALASGKKEDEDEVKAIFQQAREGKRGAFWKAWLETGDFYMAAIKEGALIGP